MESKKALEFLHQLSKYYSEQEYFELSKRFEQDILIFKKLHCFSYLDLDEKKEFCLLAEDSMSLLGYFNYQVQRDRISLANLLILMKKKIPNFYLKK